MLPAEPAAAVFGAKAAELSTKVAENLWRQFKAEAAAVYQAPLEC